MSVEIAFSDKTADHAVLLLAAAEKVLGDQTVVTTTTDSFIVPDEVAKEAGFNSDGEAKAPAKKAPAKKKAKK